MKWDIKITPKEKALLKPQTEVRLRAPQVHQTPFKEKLSKSFSKSFPISFNCPITAILGSI